MSVLLPPSSTPSGFLHRLQRVRQAALATDADGESSSSPLLLCVAGSDGCSSVGSHSLLKYLLLGATALDVVTPHAELPEPFEEVIVGVHAQGVRIVCTPQLRPSLEWLTRTTRGVEITCRRRVARSAAEADDDEAPEEGDVDQDAEADEDELFKVHAFIALTQGFQHVILPTLADAASMTQEQLDTRARAEIESWPLVQAYGLDELGAHGFFTLTHSVSAFNLHGYAALREVDAQYVVHLLSERLPAFTSHFHSACSQLLHAAIEPTPAGGQALTVGQLNREVRGVWDYGLDALSASDRAARASARPPSVSIYGPTGLAPFDSDKPVRQAGAKHYTGLNAFYAKVLEAQPWLPLGGLLPLLAAHSHFPLHAVVHLSDPLSLLSCTRTILLRQTVGDQEPELDVLEQIVPPQWKKKRRRIVREEEEDGGEDGSRTPSRGRSDAEDDEEEDSSAEEEEEEEEESSSESEDPDTDEEVKEESKKPAKPAKAPKPKVVKAPPPRMKREAPGLRDAQLLQVCYDILVQEGMRVITDVAQANGVSTQPGAGVPFPTFATLRSRLLDRLAPLARAKWILPSFIQRLEKSSAAASPSASSPAAAASTAASGTVFEVELARVDALGHRTAVDLSASSPHTLVPGQLYTFTMHLHQLPSRELLSLTEDDLVLGSVAWGESFVWREGIGGVVGAAASSSAAKSMTADELAEEARRKADPTYYGSGLTSSSAINAFALAAGGASPPSSASSLLLTASVPSSILLPSFFQAQASIALAAMISSYSHASASGDKEDQQQQERGLVPTHGQLGKFLFDGFTPKLQSNLLALPPTSATAASIGLRSAGYTLGAFVPQPISRDVTSLLLHRDDAFLSSSPLTLPIMVLTSSAAHPVLLGSIAFWRRGFLVHSAAGGGGGSFLVEFSKHVLETAWYDGASEEWPSVPDDDEEEDDEGDEDDLDGASARDEADDFDDSDDGDALFTLDLLEPTSPADGLASPYTLLRSFALSQSAELEKLAPKANEGVPEVKSKFAKSIFSLAIVFPKGSALRRAFVQQIQPEWKEALEELNIHNDVIDQVPEYCRAVYGQVQEQHEAQRRDARRAKREANGGASAQPNPSLTLPDATCDFIASLKVQEQLKVQQQGAHAASPPSSSGPSLPALAQRLLPAPTPRLTLSSLKVLRAARASRLASAAGFVSVVLGVPGSGHAEAMASVVEASGKPGAQDTWVVVELVATNGDLTAEQVSKAIQDALRQQSGTPPTKPRILLCLVTFAGVVPSLLAIQSSLSSSFPSHLLTSVTCLLHASIFFQDGPSHAQMVPGVSDQLVRGWTGASVLVTPAAAEKSDALVTAVRRRINVLHPRLTTLVRSAGKRLPSAELAPLLTSTRFLSASSERRRAAYTLAHVAPVPRPASLLPGGVHSHLFRLSGDILLDRARFFAALARFTTRRVVYHTDAERAHEEREVQRRLEVIGEAHAGGAIAASATPALAPGRIVFTTSSSSLPSPFSVVHVVAFLKFADAVSNAGGTSNRFMLVRASGGRIVEKVERRIGGTSREDTTRTKMDFADDQTPDEEVAEEEEEKATEPAAHPSVVVEPSRADVAIPCGLLPLDLRAAIASSHPSWLSSSSLSIGSVSCLLLAYGSESLARLDVSSGLLVPSLPGPRKHEKATSPWNDQVRRQAATVAEV